MAAESPWRTRSREVIQATLAALPAEATLAEKRRALRDAYPFGPKTNHPYRMWCEEVRHTLLAATSPPKIQHIHILLGPDGVLCDWCEDEGCEGCLACAKRRTAQYSMPGLGELRALLAASLDTGRGESLARNALADWYEEHGLEVEAKWVRESWDTVVARRLLEMEG